MWRFASQYIRHLLILLIGQCVEAVVVGQTAARAAQPVTSASRADALALSSLGELDGMAGVIVDLCGVDNFNLTSGYSCHYFVFGFGIAWTDCSYVHPNDMPGFASCVQGCGSTSLCERACGTELGNSYCMHNCAKVADCMHKSAIKSDQDSATDAAGDCLQGLMAKKNAAVVPMIPGAAFVDQGARRGCGGQGQDPCDPGGGSAGVRTVVPHVSSAVYPRQVYRGESESDNEDSVSSTGSREDRLQRLRKKGKYSRARGCVCDTKGMVKGVVTGQAGCGMHERETDATGTAYCYVKSADKRCKGAKASVEFKDLYWMPCNASTSRNFTEIVYVNDEYEQLFAEGCELKSGKMRRWPRLPVASTPAPQEFANMTFVAAPVDIQPFYRSELDRMLAEHLFRAHALPNDWYRDHQRLFFAPGQVPVGSPLSPGLAAALLSTTPTTTSAFAFKKLNDASRSLRGGDSGTEATTTTQAYFFR